MFAAKAGPTDCYPAGLPGGISGREPPDPISNSEVKTPSADGSVGSPHVRVGHRQAFKLKTPIQLDRGFFFITLAVTYPITAAAIVVLPF